MKKLLLLLACVALSTTTPASTSAIERIPSEVYICTGKSAKVYHYDRNCKGLCNCKSSIKKVAIEDAVKMNRRPCKICVE